LLTITLFCSFPVRKQVDTCNKEKLDALPDSQRIYYAMDALGEDMDQIPIPKKDADAVFDRFAAPAIVVLKVRIMCQALQLSDSWFSFSTRLELR
jgi:hypothetical protein